MNKYLYKLIQKFSRKNKIDDNSKIDTLSKSEESQESSLTELDSDLTEVSKFLGIPKSKILSMSRVDLDKAIASKETTRINLDTNSQSKKSQEEIDTQNEQALQGLTSKQEIDLDNKVDNKHTLAEIMNLEPGSKLLVVDSEDIENNQNTTHFSCIIKTPDGTLQNPDMLNQIGGKTSDRNVHEVDREGKVQRQNVLSTFEINTPEASNAVINIRRGQMGTLKVSYGLTDPTSHKDIFSQDLETDETYPVKSRVRSEFSERLGVYNVTNKMDEIEKHSSHGESTLSLEEADGRPDTGHIHGEEAARIILADDDFIRATNDLYTEREVAERFESIRVKNPSFDRNELIKATKNDLELDAEHMLGHQRDH